MKRNIGNILKWILFDIISINIAFVLSLIIIFGGSWSEQFIQFRYILPWFFFYYLVFSLTLKLYQRIWSFLCIYDLLLIASTTVITFFFSTLSFYLSHKINIPFSVLILAWFICLSLIAGSKLAFRIYYERDFSSKNNNKERILIIGAGNAGNTICREIEKNREYGRVIGFVDDNPKKIGLLINNKRVFNSIDKINKIIEKEKIGTVIIAIPSARGSDIRRIISLINPKNIKIKMLPSLCELLNEIPGTKKNHKEYEVKTSLIRDINVADLLDREPVNLNIERITDYIKGKRIMITGGAGTIGEELSRQIYKFEPASLILLDHSENGLFYAERKIKEEVNHNINLDIRVADIREKDKVEKIFSYFKPDIIFHAAAYKHVHLMEYHPDEAVSNNIIGTQNIVELADKYGVTSFVMISTDKAINPTSVMGASKQVAEMIVKMYGKKSKTNFVAVRFGNVLESSGSVARIFKKQILEGGPVTITHKDMARYFMTIPEATQLVIQAGALGISGEVFILNMGERIKVIDLAKQMIRLYGFLPEEDIKFKFIGMRPGEKIFEELLSETEKSQVLGKSGHDKIYIAQTEDINEKKLEKDIQELKILADNLNREGIIRKLKEIVPSYQPAEFE